jgi:hypothetical protein
MKCVRTDILIYSLINKGWTKVSWVMGHNLGSDTSIGFANRSNIERLSGILNESLCWETK